MASRYERRHTIIEPGTPGFAAFRVIQRPGTYSDNKPEIVAYANDGASACAARAQFGWNLYYIQWAGPGDCPAFNTSDHWEFGDAAAQYSYDGIAEVGRYRQKVARNG